MRPLFRGLTALVFALSAVMVELVVVYHPRSWRSEAKPPVDSAADPARLRADVEAFPPFRSRTHGPALAAMETLVQARLESLGWQVAKQDVLRTANPHRPKPTPDPISHNLIATRGLAPTGPLTVLGAHLDSVAQAPGADDNGSGVAVLLELARVLPPETAAHVELCFFNEEEDGLLGSYTFVNALSPAQRGRIPVAYVMDMVGTFDDRPHSQTYPPPLSWLAPDRGDFLSTIALADADADVQALHEAHNRVAPNLPIEMFEPSRAIAAKLRDLWRSDHAPFWEAEIPAVFITDTGPFRSNHYHSAADLSDALDFTKMALLTNLLLATVEKPLPPR